MKPPLILTFYAKHSMYDEWAQRYRWRVKRRRGGKTMADSSEAYRRKIDCENAALTLFGDRETREYGARFEVRREW